MSCKVKVSLSQVDIDKKWKMESSKLQDTNKLCIFCDIVSVYKNVIDRFLDSFAVGGNFKQWLSKDKIIPLYP